MQYIGGTGTYNLTVAGRTLYSHTNDAGLTLETGAPVIVVQEEVSNTGITRLTYTAYTTISQALDSLNDKTDFEGWISAVLNDKGTAEYIVINSADAIGFDSDDGSRPGGGIGNVYGVNGVITIPGDLGSAGNALVRAEVLAQKDGVYQATGAKPADAATGQYKNLLYFKVTNKEAGSAYTLNIRNAAGQLVYTETYAGNYPAGAVMCYVNIAPATDSVTNSGSGAMVNTDLTAGSYTYTFSCGTNSVSGTFSVK